MGKIVVEKVDVISLKIRGKSTDTFRSIVEKLCDTDKPIGFNSTNILTDKEVRLLREIRILLNKPK